MWHIMWFCNHLLKYWLFILCPPEFQSQKHKLNWVCQKTSAKCRMISKMSHWTSNWNKCILWQLVSIDCSCSYRYFVVHFGSYWSLCGPIIHLSWTFGDVWIGFKSQYESPHLCAAPDRSADSTIVWHIPISWVRGVGSTTTDPTSHLPFQVHSICTSLE